MLSLFAGRMKEWAIIFIFVENQVFTPAKHCSASFFIQILQLGCSAIWAHYTLPNRIDLDYHHMYPVASNRLKHCCHYWLVAIFVEQTCHTCMGFSMHVNFLCCQNSKWKMCRKTYRNVCHGGYVGPTWELGLNSWRLGFCLLSSSQ